MKNKGLLSLLVCSILIGCSNNSSTKSPSFINSTIDNVSTTSSIVNNSSSSIVEEVEYEFSTYYNGSLPLNKSNQEYKGEMNHA